MNIQLLRESLAIIKAEVSKIEQQLEAYDKSLTSNYILRMRFGDLVSKLKEDKEPSIKNMTLFTPKALNEFEFDEEYLDVDRMASGGSRLLKDIPVSELINIPEREFLKQRHIGLRCVTVLRKLLAKYGIANVCYD